MSQDNSEKNIFINGKRQVIELLQRMDGPDKARLLKNLRLKNPTLAKELTESCVSFESIWELSDDGLRTLLSQTQPAILGLALSLLSQKIQRRALSLLPREKAVKAFEIMQKDLSSNRIECQKAQNKMLELALNLHRNRIIQFY
jgi:flagellar motor switch protein FliG